VLDLKLSMLIEEINKECKKGMILNGGLFIYKLNGE